MGPPLGGGPTRVWFNGRTRASQARNGGSIPLTRSLRRRPPLRFATQRSTTVLPGMCSVSGSSRREPADPIEELPPHRLRQGRHVARGRVEIGETGRRDDVGHGELTPFERTESRGGGRDVRPRTVGRRDLVRGARRLDDLVDLSQQRERKLLLLERPRPEQREDTARTKDPMDLSERRMALEVMEGVPHDHRIDRAVGAGDRLRGSLLDTDRGQSLLQDCPHVRGGLDGDQVDTERGESSRELAGPGGEVDHDRAGAQRASLRDPRDRIRRVARTELVVVECIDDLEAEPGGHQLTLRRRGRRRSSDGGATSRGVRATAA